MKTKNGQWKKRLSRVFDSLSCPRKCSDLKSVRLATAARPAGPAPATISLHPAAYTMWAG